MLEGRELGRAALGEALRPLLADAPDRVLRIRVDADADYQSAATALSAARRAGFEHIGLE